MVRTVDAIPRPFGDDEPPKGNGAVMGVAVAIVVSAIVGGGVDAASVSGAVDEFSISTRSRGQTEVRIKGDDDALKATIRLRRMGGHPVKLDARSDKSCADYSEGDVQVFSVRMSVFLFTVRSSNTGRETTLYDF